MKKTTIVVMSAHALFISAMPILLLLWVFAFYGLSQSVVKQNLWLFCFVRWTAFCPLGVFCPLNGFSAAFLQLFLRREITINAAAFFSI